MLLFTLNIRNGFENKIYEILDDNRNIDIIILFTGNWLYVARCYTRYKTKI